MNISSRCEYAARAMVELAQHEKAVEPLSSQLIAERRSIPEKYLVHILLQLKRAGLVRSVRGAQGGYLLDQPANKMTLLDIVEAIDGPVLDPLPVNDATAAEMKPAWRHVAAGIEDVLRETTVSGILEKVSANDMYYI